MYWDGRPWHTLDHELKHRFGTKVYKIALNGGMTCPNRDGSLDTRGCIFCSAGGSGDFAMPLNGLGQRLQSTAYHRSRVDPHEQIPPSVHDQLQTAIHGPLQEAAHEQIQAAVHEQIQAGAARICRKLGTSPGAYIAYFQSYTNTYAPVPYLQSLFTAAIRHPQVRALSIATRPDCLPGEILDLLSSLDRIKPVWVELGLQTVHEDTASFIRRGYPLSCFQDALERLRSRGLETIVHVILGLPGESREDMLQTVRYLAGQDIQGIKLQLLHILKGTDLADLYTRQPFPLLTMEAYLDLVIDCIALLPPKVVVHRLTGDGPKSLLIAPLWSANKHLVLNTLLKRFQERGVTQGCSYSFQPEHLL